MDPKFRNLVEELMGLADSLSTVAEELKDGGELSGDAGKQFMKYGAMEIMILMRQCSAILSAFMLLYGKDYADLCLEFSTMSTDSAISAN